MVHGGMEGGWRDVDSDQAGREVIGQRRGHGLRCAIALMSVISVMIELDLDLLRSNR